MSEPLKTVVTDRPGLEAPVVVERISPLRAILVRAGRTWLQSFLGFAALLVIGSLTVDPGDWARWLEAGYLVDLGRRVLVCAVVATAVAAVSALQNAAELLAALDVTSPKWRA